MQIVIAGAKNPSTRFTISLDGLRGATTREQVDQAVELGSTFGTNKGITNWELATLNQHGRLGDVGFVRAGRSVENPFAGR